MENLLPIKKSQFSTFSNFVQNLSIRGRSLSPKPIKRTIIFFVPTKNPWNRSKLIESNCAVNDAPRLELRILRYRPLRADDSWQVHAVCWPEPRLASPGLFASLTRQFLALNKLQRSRRKTLKATLDSFNLGIASGILRMTPKRYFSVAQPNISRFSLRSCLALLDSRKVNRWIEIFQLNPFFFPLSSFSFYFADGYDLEFSRKISINPSRMRNQCTWSC